ncbi:NAD(P)/FAD-dependent oxidoreductase [Scytonema sp. HK-05]|uniref:NAD(P)/FAD-dependent oxidoreductase n=1 Tax=Scytonema sp. HK-05 TaxID=1137095 RepID=UPI0009F9918E|nr:NAD(P)/FAD-dependent oxidoreductase [Scytonema sp. HK-05]
MNDSTNPTLILGGGFTELFTALHLRHQRCSLPTVLIDKEERFIFKPLLYEFLSSEMEANQVCPRYEELLHNSGITFVQDSIQTIDLHQQKVCLTSGLHYTYSHLVLALGSTTGYFSVEGTQENSLPFRTGRDAIALTKHLRDCLQLASQAEDPQQRCTLLTVAVIGAGSSGVELAATLADLLPDWYTKLRGNSQEIRVVLLNRGKEILQGDMNSRLRETALEKRTVPVDLLMESEVTAVQANFVEFKRHTQPEVLPAATIVWTASTATHPLIKALPVAEEYRDKHGRLQVTPMLQLPDFPEVFAGGDCAVDMENPLPATAQVAYQQGAIIARNLKAISEGRSLSPAHIHLRGTLLKLGLAESAAEIFDRFEVKGKLGHLIRVATYLELLPTPVHDFKATTEWLTDEVFHLIKPIKSVQSFH